MSKIIQLKDQEGDSLYPKVLEEYSTEEKKIGKYRGKDLYRKIYHYDNLVFSANFKINHGIQNFDRPVNLNWNGYLPVVSKWYTSWDNLNARIITYTSTQIIFANEKYDYPWQDIDFIFEYTKTTD